MPSAQTTYPSASTATKYPVPPLVSDTGASSVEITRGEINIDTGDAGVELAGAAITAGTVA